MDSTLHTVQIASAAHGGHGVGRIDGQVCFIPYALPGDVVSARITRRAKGVLWGQIESVLEASPDRVEDAGCAQFGTCGACTWLHFQYPAQGEWKRRIVRDSINRIAKLDAEIGWLENPELRLGYRTRAEFHAAAGRRGFYALASHHVVDIESCPLCHAHLNDALRRLRGLQLDASVEIVVNPDGPEVLAWSRAPHAGLRAMFSTAQSPADKAARAGFLCDGVLIINGGFSQSSLSLNRLLTSAVRDATAETDHILDLYCGSGNFSVTRPAEVTVTGLDHNHAAIAAANAVRPGSYRRGDEGAFIEALQTITSGAVILDPPRSGAAAIAPALGDSRADRIVYVSCDPATLARDLKALTAKSWRIGSLTAVDMFPNTAHIETVCVLER